MGNEKEHEAGPESKLARWCKPTAAVVTHMLLITNKPAAERWGSRCVWRRHRAGNCTFS
jgi:hypothetical protein